MKIVHPTCCGLDVHKSLIVATIASTGEDGVTTYEQRSFSTLNPDLLELRGWLLERSCPAVCMESTGKYWIPVFNVLEGHVEVCLTHPKYVRARRREVRRGGLLRDQVQAPQEAPRPQEGRHSHRPDDARLHIPHALDRRGVQPHRLRRAEEPRAEAVCGADHRGVGARVPRRAGLRHVQDSRRRVMPSVIIKVLAYGSRLR